MNLIHKHCVPCEGGTPPLARLEIDRYLPQVTGWQAVDDKKIVREFKFKDFKEAMRFVNKIAEIAESENHHPNISISYSRVKLELWTHAINGLSENDFILAAKINAITE